MTHSDQELEEIFGEDVPNAVQEALVKCLFGSYRTSFDACAHFQPEEAKDLRGYYRWIQLRDELRGLGDRFPGIVATPEEYHTLITAGRIKLVACSNREPGSPLRSATYRREYADKSLNLFESPPTLASDEDYIFTILEHGVDCLEPRQPAFARILFITKDMKIAHDINLFARHKNLVDSLSIPLQSVEDGLLNIRLREIDEEASQ